MTYFNELRARIHALLHAHAYASPHVPEDDAYVSDEAHGLDLGLLTLFEQLSDNHRVWNFVLDRKYYGSGLSQFNDKLELLQNQVSGVADERLLNQLERAVQYLSVLASCLTQPLSQLLTALWGHPSIKVGSKPPPTSAPLTRTGMLLARVPSRLHSQAQNKHCSVPIVLCPPFQMAYPLPTCCTHMTSSVSTLAGHF